MLSTQGGKLFLRSMQLLGMKGIMKLDSSLHPRDLTMFDSLLDSELGSAGRCNHKTTR